MRIAAIACAAVIGLAGSAAWAGCNWHTAQSNDVVATTGTSTPATPVQLPAPETRG